MIVKETNRSGVFTVHRNEDEKPFAELHAPKAVGGRRWGIKYRGPRADRPFDPMVFNVTVPNRKMATSELEHTLRVCSNSQLCLD